MCEWVGAEASDPLLPASWEHGAAWQAHLYALFQTLALDKEFAVTLAGTSVFQVPLAPSRPDRHARSLLPGPTPPLTKP